MSLQPSERSQLILPSVTLIISAKAKQLKAQGHDIINMSAGEPDFDTPDFIKQAGIQAIKTGKTKYTAIEGTPELIDAIIHKFKRDNRLSYTNNQIIVSNGAKQSVYNACQAILNPDDEAIIPAPYWLSYPPMVALCGAKAVYLNAGIEQNFKITADQLKKAITAKTKLFFLNSPSNPTGMIYSKAELGALAAVLLKHPQIMIISDDIYEYIEWHVDGFNNIAMVCPELKDRTIVVNGFSKAYAMTGWRLGYCAATVELTKAMKKIQSHSTSNPCSISQAAGAEALIYGKEKYQYMYDAFHQRHNYFYHELKKINCLTLQPANATFYLFVDASKAIKKLNVKNDVELAAKILDEALIACVPGSAFGAPNCLRFSYVIDDNQLKVAAERLKKMFSI